MSRFNSPLRYPGGKAKLAPFIREIMEHNDLVGGEYVEPYAGGAGVALALLHERVASKVHINDADPCVFAFWKSVLAEPEAFCRRISKVRVCIEEWRRQRAVLADPEAHDRLDLGFSFFFLNRCNRSGIVAGGGPIGGIEQKGDWLINARFSKQELIRRIEAIASRASDIRLRGWDAGRYITDYLPKLGKRTLVYFDPPYYEKAERLYANFYQPDEHKDLAKMIQSRVKRPWVVSYDNAEAIRTAYEKRTSFQYRLQYNASTVCKGREIFIISDNLKMPNSSSVSSVDAALRMIGQTGT